MSKIHTSIIQYVLVAQPVLKFVQQIVYTWSLLAILVPAVLQMKEKLQKRDLVALDLLFFWILAGLILAAAWAVVNGNDIVHSVVWLSTVFLLTAGIFILAEAEFLAVIQVLVYVGAISVVIIFGIMLTKRTLKGGEDV